MLAGAEPNLGSLDNDWGVPTVPVWSLGRYGGPLRSIILSAKHERGQNLDGFLYQAGATLAVAAAEVLEPARQIWVVPAPSSWRRRWDRREIVPSVARGVGDSLAASLPGSRVRLAPALKLRVGRRSQTGRGSRARRSGREGAFSLVAEPPPGCAVVLVDDVLTTGATMREMWHEVGEPVQVGLVLARA